MTKFISNPSQETIERLARELQDHVYDVYLDQVTPLVFSDMTKYYGLTEEQIVQAMERVSLEQIESVQDLLIEQMFVGSQVDYVKDLVILVLREL